MSWNFGHEQAVRPPDPADPAYLEHLNKVNPHAGGVDLDRLAEEAGVELAPWMRQVAARLFGDDEPISVRRGVYPAPGSGVPLTPPGTYVSIPGTGLPTGIIDPTILPGTRIQVGLDEAYDEAEIDIIYDDVVDVRHPAASVAGKPKLKPPHEVRIGPHRFRVGQVVTHGVVR